MGTVEVDRRRIRQPYFSVCIPQYNRTSFLIESCKMLARQSFRDFEVCISDDCSTDGREQELLQFLDTTGLSYMYARQDRNRRYDANLRASIALASGEYCFLLGNDDRLVSASTLEEVWREISGRGSPAVALTNYQDAVTGRTFRRVRSSGVLSGTPALAATLFRNLSFVSGVVVEATLAKHHATTRWDGSEMYQMYLGSRLIAAGGSALAIDRVAVWKGLQVSGEQVDSYASAPALPAWPIVERRLPLIQIVRLVADAIAPYTDLRQRKYLVERIALQVLMFTYPFWIIEYRRVQSWAYAVGVCLGMRPGNILEGLAVSRVTRARVLGAYTLSTLGGLMIPVSVFSALEPVLYGVAKLRR